MGGLRQGRALLLTSSPPAHIRATPAIGHGGDWFHVRRACIPNHLRSTSDGTLAALSDARVPELQLQCNFQVMKMNGRYFSRSEWLRPSCLSFCLPLDDHRHIFNAAYSYQL
jgi:hypothetical protein